jgi:hypothetical protein
VKEWQKDKRWSDRFLPEIKRNLGEFLIGEPDPTEDQERNTDLIILKLDSVRIACRIRRYDYFIKYPNDFTVRSGRPSGAKSELTKIIEGWGDYLFYGFCNPTETELIAWRLLSLNVFRLWYNRELGKMDAVSYPGKRMLNGDHSSSFHSFKVTQVEGMAVLEKGFGITVNPLNV